MKQNCVKILRVPLLRHCTWWVYFGDGGDVDSGGDGGDDDGTWFL